MSRPHHRPLKPGDNYFDELESGTDPTRATEAAERAAQLLIRGAHGSQDEAVADRVVRLAEAEGLDTLAELWSSAAADTLAGSLWRLYVLRSWVHAAPSTAAEEYDAGRRALPLAEVVAGVAVPPGPDELKRMVDDTLRGIYGGEYADVLLRAAAFARIVAGGRASLERSHDETLRILRLSEDLEAAARLELRDHLG